MNRSQLALDLAANTACMTGCVLEPTLPRPGARTLRMQVQAPSIDCAIAFRAQMRQELTNHGFSADIEPADEDRTPGLPTCWTVLMCVTVGGEA